MAGPAIARVFSAKAVVKPSSGDAHVFGLQALGGGAGIGWLLLEGDPSYTPVKIQASPNGIVNNAGVIRVQTDTAHNLATGDFAEVLGTNRPEAEGIWKVTDIGALQFDLQGSTFVSVGGGGTDRKCVQRWNGVGVGAAVPYGAAPAVPFRTFLGLFVFPEGAAGALNLQFE